MSFKAQQDIKKRLWSEEETTAVERQLRKFITLLKVPGKKDCLQCIASEPEALKWRDWKAVKYFVHNKIIAKKRKL